MTRGGSQRGDRAPHPDLRSPPGVRGCAEQGHRDVRRDTGKGTGAEPSASHGWAGWSSARSCPSPHGALSVPALSISASPPPSPGCPTPAVPRSWRDEHPGIARLGTQTWGCWMPLSLHTLLQPRLCRLSPPAPCTQRTPTSSHPTAALGPWGPRGSGAPPGERWALGPRGPRCPLPSSALQPQQGLSPLSPAWPPRLPSSHPREVCDPQSSVLQAQVPAVSVKCSRKQPGVPGMVVATARIS